MRRLFGLFASLELVVPLGVKPCLDFDLKVMGEYKSEMLLLSKTTLAISKQCFLIIFANILILFVKPLLILFAVL